MRVFPNAGVNTINVGGLTLPIQGLIILRAFLDSGAFSVFFNNSFGVAPAAYTPSGATAFYLRAGKYVQENALGTTNNPIMLVYGDTSLGTGAAGPLTNPVGMLSGSAGATLSLSDWPFSSNNNLVQEFAGGGKVPNGKYPHAQFNSARGTVWLYGYEG
jgi:hypothetical protein